MAAAITGVKKVSVTVLSLFLSVCLIVSTSQAASTSTCQPDHYLDHGTNNCEHCCDICCQAEHRRTKEECQRLCPAYAKKLADKDKPVVQEEVNVPTPAPSTSPSSGPSAATSGIIAGAVLLMVAVSAGVAFLAHRRIQASKRQRRQQNPAEPAVTVPLNPPFRGVQEEGSPCLQENTWHIFQIPGMCSRQEASALPPCVAQESRHGQDGPHELALLNSSRGSSVNEEVVPKTLTPIYRPSGSMLPSTPL